MNRQTAARIPARAASWIDVAWIVLLGAASSWWCITAAQALSATFDEPTYLREGLEHWRTGLCKPLMRLGAMPLAIDVQTLPLYLWEKWRGVSIDPVADLPWALGWMRAATLAFWWLLLIYVWRSASAIAGPWAGRLAVAMVACEPIFLAHAGLGTSDLPVTACLLVFLFEFRKHRDAQWPLRVALPAALYGIALLAKASALAFGVIGMLVIELERLIASGALANRGATRAAFIAYLRDSTAIVFGGFAVAFAYVGSDWNTEPSFIEWARTLEPGALRDAMLWTSEHLRIFSNAGEGLVQQIKHNIRGHLTFLLGQEYKRSVWFYFPVALTIKTTLFLLLLPALLALFCRRALWNWAALTAAALFLFSITCRVQIGVRFMLPLLALLAVGMAAAAVNAWHSLGSRRRLVLVTFLGAGLSWNAAAAIAVWPQALCYVNPAWGGTPNGYRLVSDSNYDWGQGLLELDAWRERNRVDTLHVWYFGFDPRASAPPLAQMQLHSAEWLNSRSPAEAVTGKRVAVSTTLLYGGYMQTSAPGRAAVAFFRDRQPVGRTTTYFIYDFTAERR